jgi:invasion protein IalB
MFARGDRFDLGGHAGRARDATAPLQRRVAEGALRPPNAAVDAIFKRDATNPAPREKLGWRVKRTLLRTGLLLPMVLGSGAIGQQTVSQPRSAARPQSASHGRTTSQSSPHTPSATAQPTVAQQQERQASLGTSPQRTTATYDDWVVQCETAEGTPPHKRCEMTQTTQLTIQGRRQPFSRAAIVRPAKDRIGILVIQLPVNVSIAANVRIQIADNDTGISTPFARCVPSGCFAELELKEETLKKFRAASAAGKISFADAGSRNLSVPLSFNGFGKAYDALLRE